MEVRHRKEEKVGEGVESSSQTELLAEWLYVESKYLKLWKKRYFFFFYFLFSFLFLCSLLFE